MNEQLLLDGFSYEGPACGRRSAAISLLPSIPMERQLRLRRGYKSKKIDDP